MFTGIVTDIGTVIGVTERNDVKRLQIATSYPAAGIDIGASISCAGVCLTVIAREDTGDGKSAVDFEAGSETLSITTVANWDYGTRVNLERALKVGDELGGHLMTGHVDGVAMIVTREDFGETTRFVFEAPHALARFIAAKGSVALDGTSLTVNGVDGDRFECLLIPHTLKVTTWNERKPGDRVNLEVDTIARYVARLNAVAGGDAAPQGIDQPAS
jgi:riboflavin synthase